jgi:N-acylneuraminate cytidylyltransferase
MTDAVTIRNVVAIIPARGGSKGIPLKNIQLVGGKPLLAHTIEDARRSRVITRVVVSTDHAGIAAVAREHGVEVIWRPPDISDDAADSESALLHSLDYLKHTEGYEPHLVVFLQATSPLRAPEDIDQAIAQFDREGADSLFSSCAVHGFVWRQEAERLSSFTYDYRHRRRRQDAPRDLIENGSIYLFKPWVLREHNNRLGGKIATYAMDPINSFQVDQQRDLKLMEQLLSLKPRYRELPDLAQVRLLVVDFDGVMTNNLVLMDQDGRESVLCHRGDGWGIGQLMRTGVAVVVLSTESTSVVSARCRKLGITCIQGCSDKLSTLKEFAKARGVAPEEIMYVGNDENDLECMRWVGFPVAVADAEAAVRAGSVFITKRRGGDGAVREVCDLLRASQPAMPF